MHSDDEVLTPYQKAVNNASLQLVKNDCALLQNRGELFALARKKVDEDGFAYRRKHHGPLSLERQLHMHQSQKGNIYKAV